MYTLTDHHKELVEALPDISKVYGVYLHQNGSEYFKIRTVDGKDSSRGVRSTLKRCGISLPIQQGTCDTCSTDFTRLSHNQKYCSVQCKKVGRKDQIYLNSRKAVVSKYGLTLEQYDSMVAEQQGLCKICKEIPKRIVIDHCHSTGKVRGLLCVRCNSCLGWYEKYNLDAVKYLQP